MISVWRHKENYNVSYGYRVLVDKDHVAMYPHFNVAHASAKFHPMIDKQEEWELIDL